MITKPGSYGSEKLRFRILGPTIDPTAASRLNVTVDPQLHAKMLFDVQLLRGSALREYFPLADGLTSDGRHFQSADGESWHVLLENERGRVRGCARYRPITRGFNQLGARESALAKSITFGTRLRREVENHFRRAQAANMQYGEAGGWVLSPEIRGSTAAINIALMTFALASQLGGGIGITTATTRHYSAAILRRLGGHRLGGLPAYYDPKYGCIIELLAFDMKSVAPQFASRIEAFKNVLKSMQVVCRPSDGETSHPHVPFGSAHTHRTTTTSSLVN